MSSNFNGDKENIYKKEDTKDKSEKIIEALRELSLDFLKGFSAFLLIALGIILLLIIGSKTIKLFPNNFYIGFIFVFLLFVIFLFLFIFIFKRLNISRNSLIVAQIVPILFVNLVLYFSGFTNVLIYIIWSLFGLIAIFYFYLERTGLIKTKHNIFILISFFIIFSLMSRWTAINSEKNSNETTKDSIKNNQVIEDSIDEEITEKIPSFPISLEYSNTTSKKVLKSDENSTFEKWKQGYKENEVFMETSDDSSTVYSYYQKVSNENKWDITSSQFREEDTSSISIKGENFSSNLVIYPNKETKKTEIKIFLYSE